MIVSEVPGTTRDSVDVRFERDGKTFIAIDTAGVRRKKSIADDIEFYSLARAERSIRRADVVLLFFDPQRPHQQGGQAARRVHPRAAQAGHLRRQQVGPDEAACRRASWAITSGRRFPSLDYVPIAFITAKAGKNVQAVLEPGPEPAQAGQRPRQHRRPQPRAPAGAGSLSRRRCGRTAGRRSTTPRRWPPIRRRSCCSPTARSCSTTLPALLAQDFRDHLPFADVPIKLYLRQKRRQDETPADVLVSLGSTEKQGPRNGKSSGDAADLKFRSAVSDEEIDRDRGALRVGVVEGCLVPLPKRGQDS